MLKCAYVLLCRKIGSDVYYVSANFGAFVSGAIVVLHARKENYKHTLAQSLYTSEQHFQNCYKQCN